MTINEKTLGADHPEYSIDLNNLAEILEKQVNAGVFSWTDSYLYRGQALHK